MYWRNYYREFSIEFSKGCILKWKVGFLQMFCRNFKIQQKKKWIWDSKFVLSACQVVVPSAYCLLFNVKKWFCTYMWCWFSLPCICTRKMFSFGCHMLHFASSGWVFKMLILLIQDTGLLVSQASGACVTR